MDRWAAARSRAFDAFGCLRSLRARAALDWVSRVHSGSVEIAAGPRPHASESAPSSAPSLGRRSRSGARFGLLSGDVSRYAGLNSVPCRSIACMMIASRRERDACLAHRPALSDGQSPSLQLQGLPAARQHHVGGFVQQRSAPPVEALRDAARCRRPRPTGNAVGQDRDAARRRESV